MTGVGAAPHKISGGGGGHPWGGAAPSVVEVPAVVLEGSADGGKSWREIPFRCAPGVS